MGLFVGEIRLFLTEFLPLFTLEKQFLVYYSFTIYDMSMKLYSYVYHQRYQKEPLLKLFQFRTYLPLIDRKMFLTCSSSTIWNF